MDLNKGRELPGATNDADRIQTRLLSEDELRKISKSLPDLIPRTASLTENPSNEIQRLLLDLPHTANSANLSPTHGAAALNALCGLLDLCSSSSSANWSSLCFNHSICTRIFEIFLTRSENFKPKPARRLLVTLTNILSKYPEGEERLFLTRYVVSYCVRAISKEEDATSIKSVIQVLDHFIGKKVITAFDVVFASNRNATQLEGSVSQSTGSLVAGYSETIFRKNVEDFTWHTLSWVRYPDCAPAIARFLPCLYGSLDAFLAEHTASYPSTASQETPLWIKPVKASLEQDISLLDSLENHILPGMLRLSSEDRDAFLAMLPLKELQQGDVGSQTDAEIQFCVLAVRTAGLSLKKTDNGKSNMQHIEYLEPTRLGMNLIEHSSATVRMVAFSLLTSSAMSTAPLPTNVLECLQEYIPNFHQETNQKTRNEFIAMMKPLCSRLRSAAKAFSSISAASGERYRVFPNADENLVKHICFAQWYQGYLLHELRPTASYQSHITALKILPLVFEQNVLQPLVSSNRIHIDQRQESDFRAGEGNVLDHVRALLDLLLDPFDDVRQSASSVLCQIVPSTYFTGWRYRSSDEVNIYMRTDEIDHNKFVKAIELALGRAENQLQRTGRADHADGVGRLYKIYYGIAISWRKAADINDRDPFSSLLSSLEQGIDGVNRVLPHTFASALLHGHLIALRYIVSEEGFAASRNENHKSAVMQDLYARLFACCNHVWHAVRTILCFDAPEGRNLEDEDSVETDNGSKDTLSFCWRALKESSLLMHAVINKASPSLLSRSAILHDDDYCVYGNLIFTQLAELRHRGAFSTVAQTFAAWCIVCSNSEKFSISALPRKWYHSILACIQQQAGALTRRSAGLPAMVTGVLAAFPSGSFFDDVVLDLQAIADAPTETSEGSIDRRLPQVHALNCLKDVFTDSRFGPSTESHMTSALGIAISSLESNVWAIRNCGLMLLKALLKRLNGGADTASTRLPSSHRQLSRLTYEKFPILPELLLKLLYHQADETTSILQAQRVFPALEIVERFGIPDVHHNEILHALKSYQASPIWAIREKAAKALSVLLRKEDFGHEVQDLIGSDVSSQNELHGRLLSLRFLLARVLPIDSRSASDKSSFLDHLEALFESFAIRGSCPFTIATSLNIIADATKSLFSMREYSAISSFLGRLERALLVKQAVHLKRQTSSDSAWSSENDAISRCFDVLRDINETSFGSIANDLIAPTGKEGPQLGTSLETPSKGSIEHLGGPYQYNKDLELWGRQIAVGFPEPGVFPSPFTRWLRALCLAGDAYSEVSTRLAAVHSIEKFFVELPKAPLPNTATFDLVELFAVLYDTLVDDDEEVRNCGARVVSSILSVERSKLSTTRISVSLSPPAAGFQLLQFLAAHHGASKQLLAEAIWRLTGVAASSDIALRARHLSDWAGEDIISLGLPSVPNRLQLAKREHDVVFEEEKQNLYLDPVIEADTWAQVMIEMDGQSWPANSASTLTMWTEDGLTCLLAALDRSIDGPLGLTSKDEVYALFVQVVLTARVLLVTKRRLAPTQDRPDVDQIAAHLRRLWHLGQRNDLHPLILNRLKRILGEIEVEVE